jgi:Tfp pilus assembly protein PilN
VIRINLLEETRVATKSKGGGGGGGLPKIQVAENVPLMMLAGGFALAVAAVAIYGMIVHKQLTDLESAISAAEQKKKQLEFVLKKDEELRKRKEDLARKIQIIADLKSRQALPVQLMDLLSRNLAEHVWLDEVVYAGDAVTVKGQAQTNIAVSSQLRNLEESKYFRDVAMGNINANESTGLTTFQIDMTFNPSGTSPAAQKPAASGPGAPPAS